MTKRIYERGGDEEKAPSKTGCKYLGGERYVVVVLSLVRVVEITFLDIL